MSPYPSGAVKGSVAADCQCYRHTGKKNCLCSQKGWLPSRSAHSYQPHVSSSPGWNPVNSLCRPVYGAKASPRINFHGADEVIQVPRYSYLWSIFPPGSFDEHPGSWWQSPGVSCAPPRAVWAKVSIFGFEPQPGSDHVSSRGFSGWKRQPNCLGFRCCSWHTDALARLRFSSEKDTVVTPPVCKGARGESK